MFVAHGVNHVYFNYMVRLNCFEVSPQRGLALGLVVILVNNRPLTMTLSLKYIDQPYRQIMMTWSDLILMKYRILMLALMSLKLMLVFFSFVFSHEFIDDALCLFSVSSLLIASQGSVLHS
ncbi:MAG: hypothetical protein ACI8WB_004452 [Phenylobacterium sp.]|jgi:hypothetical protein